MGLRNRIRTGLCSSLISHGIILPIDILVLSLPKGLEAVIIMELIGSWVMFMFGFAIGDE